MSMTDYVTIECYRDAQKRIEETQAHNLLLSAEIKRLRGQIGEMVEKNAEQHLDGYRELGAKCASLESKIDQLHILTQKLQSGIAVILNLIESSEGVYGLHQNGDPAPWDDLREGGRYEDWLRYFDRALAALDELKTVNVAATEKRFNSD